MFAANVPDGQVKDSDTTKDMPSCFCATEEGLIGPKYLVGNSLPCAFNAQEICSLCDIRCGNEPLFFHTCLSTHVEKFVNEAKPCCLCIYVCIY